MSTFQEYAHTEEFRQAVRVAVDRILRDEIVPPIADALSSLRSEVVQLRAKVQDELATKVRVLERLEQDRQAREKNAG